jgi:hypothetical protein
VSPDQRLLHPGLKPFEFLVGTWRGHGAGSYPGSKPFEYTEELTFSHSGDAVLAYSMRARHLTSGEALHAEHGFFKCSSDAEVDVVIAHATGHVEVSRGSVHGESVDFVSTSVTSWRGGDPVVSLSRRLSLEGSVLTDRLEMQAMGQDLQGHVRAELSRD